VAALAARFLLELLTQSAAKFSLPRHWRTGSQLYRDRTRASDDGAAGRSRPTGIQWCVIHALIPLGFLSYSGKHVVWYIGWQPSGIFGVKSTFIDSGLGDRPAFRPPPSPAPFTSFSIPTPGIRLL